MAGVCWENNNKKILQKVLKPVPTILEMPELSEQWNWVHKFTKDAALHPPVLSPNSPSAVQQEAPAWNLGQQRTDLSQDLQKPVRLQRMLKSGAQVGRLTLWWCHSWLTAEDENWLSYLFSSATRSHISTIPRRGSAIVERQQHHSIH